MIQRDLRRCQRYVRNHCEALMHLLLHCCYKDGECNEKEIDAITNILQRMHSGSGDDLFLARQAYCNYARHISDDLSYLRFLLHHIRPSDPVALLDLCVEVTTSDRFISLSEELLISKLANLLQVPAETTRSLHWERLKAVV